MLLAAPGWVGALLAAPEWRLVRMPIDASDRPNDRFGHSVYAGVLFAGPEQVKAVAELRGAIKPRRATLPAHVTVMGTFCDPPSLDAVKAVFADAARLCGPVEVRFDGTGLHLGNDWASFQVTRTTDLVRLHETLTDALIPLVTDAYGYAEHGYAPHLTLWQECPPENMAQAERLGRKLDLGAGFRGEEVALVARTGPAHGGKWATLKSFRLGR